MGKFDWSDVCVFVGVLLIGFAVGWAWGLVVLAFYAGLLLIGLGLVLARRGL